MVFIETPPFTRRLQELLDDVSSAAFQRRQALHLSTARTTVGLVL